MSSNKTQTQPANEAVAALGIEWIKPLVDVSGKFYAEMLSFTAQRLHTQADYLQGLASCTNPMELFQQQARFFQNAVQDYSNEAVKTLKSA